jgi:hypothetical protein
MDEASALAELIGGKNVSEAYHVTTFKGYRVRPDGTDKEVTITVLDSGPSKPDSRYRVRVDDEDGNHADGNPADRIDLAISFVHWENIDV